MFVGGGGRIGSRCLGITAIPVPGGFRAHFLCLPIPSILRVRFFLRCLHSPERLPPPLATRRCVLASSNPRWVAPLPSLLHPLPVILPVCTVGDMDVELFCAGAAMHGYSSLLHFRAPASFELCTQFSTLYRNRISGVWPARSSAQSSTSLFVTTFCGIGGAQTLFNRELDGSLYKHSHCWGLCAFVCACWKCCRLAYSCTFVQLVLPVDHIFDFSPACLRMPQCLAIPLCRGAAVTL